MARRILFQVVLIVGITIVISWLILGAFALTDSVDPIGTFVDQTFRVIFGLLGLALGLWALLVTLGAIGLRRRMTGWRIASHVLSLVVALVVNVVVLTIVALVANGGGGDSWGFVVVAIAAAAGTALLVAGVISVLLVELVIMRPRPPLLAAEEPVLTAP